MNITWKDIARSLSEDHKNGVPVEASFGQKLFERAMAEDDVPEYVDLGAWRSKVVVKPDGSHSLDASLRTTWAMNLDKMVEMLDRALEETRKARKLEGEDVPADDAKQSHVDLVQKLAEFASLFRTPFRR